MKSFLMLIAATALALTMTGCGSLRTPPAGPNANKVYYNTFFGVSVESAVYGDGVIVGK
jgi:uncharacterized protein YceK